jgi:hypothetical protein
MFRPSRPGTLPRIKFKHAGTRGGTVGRRHPVRVGYPSSGVNAGIALLRSATTLNLSERLDAVGYATVGPLYREGTGLTAGGSEQVFNLQYAFGRNLVTGAPLDADNSGSDFISLHWLIGVGNGGVYSGRGWLLRS